MCAAACVLHATTMTNLTHGCRMMSRGFTCVHTDRERDTCTCMHRQKRDTEERGRCTHIHTNAHRKREESSIMDCCCCRRGCRSASTTMMGLRHRGQWQPRRQTVYVWPERPVSQTQQPFSYTHARTAAAVLSAHKRQHKLDRCSARFSLRSLAYTRLFSLSPLFLFVCSSLTLLFLSFRLRAPVSVCVCVCV